MKFFSFDCFFFSFFSFKRAVVFMGNQMHFSSLQIPSPLAIDFLRECVCDTKEEEEEEEEEEEGEA